MLTRQHNGRWARRGAVLLAGAVLAAPVSADSVSSPPIEAVIQLSPPVVTRASSAAVLSPFSDFEDPSLTDYAIKLTYLGEQDEPVTTVVAVEQGGMLNAARFLPFRNGGVSYGNDDLTRPDGTPALASFTATAEEMRALIDAVGATPAASAGANLPNDLAMSYMMVAAKNGSDIGFEAILDRAAAWQVLAAMQAVLTQNENGRALIGLSQIGMCGDHGCPTQCAGDCQIRRQVTIDNLVAMVNIALGASEVYGCLAGDRNHDGRITVDEIIAAVGNALAGCAMM
jgi:hypothetical protein